ncbi:MAG TPA: HEAT repeat domain-containing protein [Abditibacteriaceae bacterium]
MVNKFQLLWFLLLLVNPALAFMPPNVSTLELAQDSDVVLVGTMRSIKDGQAEFAVEQVLKGVKVAPVIKVAPINKEITMGTRLFREGETLVLFLKGGDILKPMLDGWGSLTFNPETKNETIEGVNQLLLLPPRSEKDAIAQAMLAWAISDNFLLRREAHRYISQQLYNRDNGLKYQKQLVELLKNPSADVRAAALSSSLQFMASPEALPLIIEMTRGTDLRLVQSASMALAHYHTPESVAALIALTRHLNPDLRMRALIDLDDSGSLEAKAALVALLDDPNPKVRALAPRGLVMWLRRGEAKDVLPKLITMLKDPVDEVRARAAQEIGESRDVSTIPALLEVLRRPNLSETLEARVTGALYLMISNLRPDQVTELKELKEAQQLFIVSLERSRRLPSLHVANILGRLGKNKTLEATAALRHAEEKHPHADVRGAARHALAMH